MDARIVVVGGGPAGLATAITLKRKGFKNLVIYERDADSDARLQGYSFNLFAPVGGLAVLEGLGFDKELDPISYVSQGARFVDSETGSVLLHFDAQTSQVDAIIQNGRQRARRVMRAGLRKLLIKVCEDEGVKIVWNSRIVNFEEKDSRVLLNFENQKTQECDLLIGADGTNSVIRKGLIGDELIYTGYTIVGGLSTRQSNPEAFEHPWFHKTVTLGTGRGVGFFATYHVNDEIYWGVGREVPKGEYDKFGNDKQKLKEELLKHTSAMIPLFRSIIEKGEIEKVLELHDRNPLKITKVKRLTDRRNSRITLIGDAAHPMVPFRAQGGNNALIDASALAAQLSSLLSSPSSSSGGFNEEDLIKALSNYEQEMISRTSKEVYSSRQAMYSVHSRSPVAIFFRNSILSLLNWRLNIFPHSYWQPMLFKLVIVGAVGGLASWVYSRIF